MASLYDKKEQEGRNDRKLDEEIETDSTLLEGKQLVGSE